PSSPGYAYRRSSSTARTTSGSRSTRASACGAGPAGTRSRSYDSRELATSRSSRAERSRRSTPRPCSSGSQHDRDRPVVHELYLHPRTEDARRDLDAERPKRLAEPLVERLGLLRRGRGREARPVALRCVGEQRELAHDERGAAGVEEAAVETPLLVLEDP